MGKITIELCSLRKPQGILMGELRMKTKLMLSALIIIIAILLSFSIGNLVSVLSYWVLSVLLIYCLFRDNEEAEEKE